MLFIHSYSKPGNNLLTATPPTTLTPFTWETSSWFRSRVPLAPSSCLSRQFLYYCTLLSGSLVCTTYHLPEDHTSRCERPLGLSWRPSCYFLLAHLSSSLPTTNMQKHSIPGKPQPPHFPDVQRGWQTQRKGTPPNQDKIRPTFRITFAIPTSEAMYTPDQNHKHHSQDNIFPQEPVDPTTVGPEKLNITKSKRQELQNTNYEYVQGLLNDVGRRNPG